MWRLTLNFFLTRFSILYPYWPLKFLCLNSEIIQIIIFIFNDMLRGRSLHIQNTPGTTSVSILCSYWQIQAEMDLIG
jgi:hypothetical protein